MTDPLRVSHTTHYESTTRLNNGRNRDLHISEAPNRPESPIQKDCVMRSSLRLITGGRQRKFYRSFLFLVALLTFASTSQSVEKISASPVSLTATISIGEFFFIPPSVTISSGDTVQWVNDGVISHTTTGFNSP